jgi:hypothetical protein
MVEISDQMNQTLLLLTCERVVRGIEVRYKDAVEILEQFSQKASLSGSFVQKDDFFQVRKDPYIPFPHTSEIHFGLIGMNERPTHNILQEALIGLFVIARQQPFEGINIWGRYRDSEVLLALIRDVRQARPMLHVFIHGPTFYRMGILIETQVFPRQESLLTPITKMPRGREACHPSPDTAWADPEIAGQSREPSILPPRYIAPAAEGA